MMKGAEGLRWQKMKGAEPRQLETTPCRSGSRAVTKTHTHAHTHHCCGITEEVLTILCLRGSEGRSLSWVLKHEQEFSSRS